MTSIERTQAMKTSRQRIVLLLTLSFSFFLVLPLNILADELVFFANGEKMPVKATKEKGKFILLELLTAGEIAVKKTYIVRVEDIETGSVKPYEGLVITSHGGQKLEGSIKRKSRRRSVRGGPLRPGPNPR